MSASSIGSLVLIVIGLAFLAAAITSLQRTRADPAGRPASRLGPVIDLLVGLVALADGTVSTLGAPDAAVVWSVGTALLVVVIALLLVLRHHSV